MAIAAGWAMTDPVHTPWSGAHLRGPGLSHAPKSRSAISRMEMRRDTLASVSDETLLVLYATGAADGARALTLRLALRVLAYAMRVLRRTGRCRGRGAIDLDAAVAECTRLAAG